MSLLTSKRLNRDLILLIDIKWQTLPIQIDIGPIQPSGFPRDSNTSRSWINQFNDLLELFVPFMSRVISAVHCVECQTKNWSADESLDSLLLIKNRLQKSWNLRHSHKLLLTPLERILGLKKEMHTLNLSLITGTIQDYWRVFSVEVTCIRLPSIGECVCGSWVHVRDGVMALWSLLTAFITVGLDKQYWNDVQWVFNSCLFIVRWFDWSSTLCVV